MLGGVFIILVAVAIGLGVSFGTRGGKPAEDTSTVEAESPRLAVEDDIGNVLAGITQGGWDTLLDGSTAHHRAWQWLVYEDGMELDAAADHLHQRYVLTAIQLSGSVGSIWGAFGTYAPFFLFPPQFA